MNLSTSNKIQYFVISFIVLLVLAATLTSNIVRSTHNKGDFGAIYNASEHAIKTSTLNDSKSLGYYPPSARPFFLLFALLPKVYAMTLWWLISVIIYTSAFYLTLKYIIPSASQNSFSVLSITFLLSLPWLISDLNVGNVSTIVLISILGSYILHRNGHEILAGLVLASGIAIKLIPIFMLIFFAIRGKWKQTIITIICLFIVGIIPGVLIFGYHDFTSSWHCWREHAVKIRTAEHTIMHTNRLSYMNQAWPNILARTLHHIDAGHRNHPFFVNIANLSKNTILKIWYIFAAISLLIWLYAIKPNKQTPLSSEQIAFGLAPPIVIWFSPHVLSYYLTILIPSLMLIVWAIVEKNSFLRNTRIKLQIILVIYIALCLTTASPYLRAIGSYQLIVLLCFIGVYLILRDSTSQVQKDHESRKTSA